MSDLITKRYGVGVGADDDEGDRALSFLLDSYHSQIPPHLSQQQQHKYVLNHDGGFSRTDFATTAASEAPVTHGVRAAAVVEGGFNGIGRDRGVVVGGCGGCESVCRCGGESAQAGMRALKAMMCALPQLREAVLSPPSSPAPSSTSILTSTLDTLPRITLSNDKLQSAGTTTTTTTVDNTHVDNNNNDFSDMDVADDIDSLLEQFLDATDDGAGGGFDFEPVVHGAATARTAAERTAVAAPAVAFVASSLLSQIPQVPTAAAPVSVNFSHTANALAAWGALAVPAVPTAATDFGASAGVGAVAAAAAAASAADVSATAAAAPLPETTIPYFALTKEQRRERALMRYRAKRKRRVWTKKTEYTVRKTVANGRTRVNGRFVRKGSAFVSVSAFET